MSGSSWSRLASLGVVAAALAAGCAKKEAEPVAQAGPNHVIVTAADYAFQAPDSITAGLDCFFPDAKDGKQHVMHGMVKQITVD